MAQYDPHKMTKEIVQKCLDTIVYDGKTFREWIEIVSKYPKVPCLECKHYEPDWFYCCKLGIDTDHDFFCAYGEMEGDAHDDNG